MQVKVFESKFIYIMNPISSIIGIVFTAVYYIWLFFAHIRYKIFGPKQILIQPVNNQKLNWRSWQNPSLQDNKNGSDIHVDSYQTNIHLSNGPSLENKLIKTTLYDSIITKDGKSEILGECASFTWTYVKYNDDGQIRNDLFLITVSSTNTVVAYKNTGTVLKQVAIYKLNEPANLSFSTGYYFMSDKGHIFAANGGDTISELSFNGKHFKNIRNVNIQHLLKKNDQLYAILSGKNGYIWFTTRGAIIGIITPDDKIIHYDINEHSIYRENIADSIAVGSGDNENSPSEMYLVTTYKMYRFGIEETDNGIKIVEDWSEKYDRGSYQKPGQVSFGCGTTPTLFDLYDKEGHIHKFVTICDNATFGMNVLVYRAETKLKPGQNRLAAKLKPFGNDILVSDENSLVTYPILDNITRKQVGAAIISENNYGNPFLNTIPGLSRIDFTLDGAQVTSVNRDISVPTVVTKANSQTGLVYTYEKRFDEYWYLTALSAENLQRVNFSYKIGKGQPFNSSYAALALSPDGNVVIGTTTGFVFAKFDSLKN